MIPPPASTKVSWPAAIASIATRLTPRALSWLSAIFLVFVFGLLAFGLATGRDVNVSWTGISFAIPVQPIPIPPEAATEEEISQMTAGGATDEAGLRLYLAARDDSLRVYREFLEKPEFVFLQLDEILDQERSASINTAWTEGNQTRAYQLIQRAIGLVYPGVEVNSDRDSTFSLVARFQQDYNARAMETGAPELQPRGMFGRRTLRAIQDSFHSQGALAQ